MPGFDGTGPMGQGPMTGGGRGYCAMPVRGAGPYGGGRGYGGRGRGGGRGWRHRYYATGVPGWMRAQAGGPAFGGPGYGAPYAMPKEEELAALKDQIGFFKSQMEDLQTRIRELEGQPSDQGA